MTTSVFSTTAGASEVLAAALEQMDGIIAGTKNGPIKTAIPPPQSNWTCDRPKTVSTLLEELRAILEDNTKTKDDGYQIADHIRAETRDFVLRWLQGDFNTQTNGFSPDYDELREKIQRLERDKETLVLQVSVLNEQIDAQNEKIRDAEIIIRERRERADRAEELLQREMTLRSSLESQKQTLMNEIGHLKMRVSTLEKDKQELHDKTRNNKDFSSNLWSMEQADGSLSGRLSKPPTPDPSKHLALGVSEIEKMKRALESVMAANDEKDRKIEELRGAMMRYKRIQDRMLQNKKDDSIDVASVMQYTNYESARFSPVNGKLIEKPPLAPRPIASSTPLQSKAEMSSNDQLSPQMNLGRRSVSPTPRKISNFCQGSEETLSQPPKTPPSRSRSSIEHYGTVPRNYAPLLQAELSSTLPTPTATPTKSKSSFGKGFLKFKSGSRSSSAPNLAHTEVAQLSQESSPATPEHQKEKKGLKKIFGKLKRSNSQTMDGDPLPAEFQRGGLRATAGPRLGWSRNLKGDKETSTFYDTVEGTSTFYDTVEGIIDVPFARWDTDEIISWMHELGLTSYVSECKRWIRNGDQLLNATPAALEKELGMKNTLHRKKLSLALRAMGTNSQDCHKGLDHYWVQRWLDDVGLPQYKDSFMDARVDGRMLHHLTAEDLTQLKVSSLLHVISLRQGIQVLRFHDFDPNCLKRRSSPLEPNPPPPSDVALWTNHRVMEWLRSVDLSEYAPNLRGSGVHGALMIFEPRFGAELLATLLSIPPNKTLLRRHLNTQFKELIGSTIMQQKRDKESEPGYAPLTPSTKVKVMKKSQFSIMRKRGKAEMDLEDFVCPLENQDAKVVADAVGINPQLKDVTSNGSSSKYPEKDKKAAREIGAVSKEINCLTDMLQNEKMFASMAASNV